MSFSGSDPTLDAPILPKKLAEFQNVHILMLLSTPKFQMDELHFSIEFIGTKRSTIYKNTYRLAVLKPPLQSILKSDTIINLCMYLPITQVILHFPN